jgi:gas vesicle protein GvpA/GvpJ/GvpM family
VEGQSLPTRRYNPLPGRPETQTNLADILERVLDKGIVIAGDIQINLLEVELLTIKLRLLIASVDRAREMGINWWETDTSLQSLTPGEDLELEQENRDLRERVERLERQLGVGNGDSPPSPARGADASGG